VNAGRLTGVCVVAIVAAALGSAAPSRGASGLGPLIVEPDQGYAPIYALLRSPKKTLDLTMYKLRDAQAQQALIEDANRGVKVRVLLDRLSGGSFNQSVFDDLKAHGVSVAWGSTKVSITHQKSFVIDRKKAVILTGNFQEAYYSGSRDYALVDTKAKDVAAIESTFDLDRANSPVTAASGSDLLWSPGSEAKLVSLIASAKHTLRVENEELKEPAIVSALAAAAKRGVAVQLLMMDQSGWRANFRLLKAAGVDVRTFALSAPLYIHAKAMVVDARRVFLGSENFSVRSLQENRELGIVTWTKAVVAAVQVTFARDFAAAKPW
jgi:phosphatidylserine/phosphatidylglycerophosphate/cardiolipin synthase-like enzyme